MRGNSPLLRPFVRISGRQAMLVAGLVGAMVIHTLMSLAVKDWMLDDAFISFRYAENLVKGQGLVYNPGERVEGYTNFLWVLILSLFRGLGLETVRVARVLGLVLSLSGLWALAGLSRQRAPSRDGTAGIPPLLLLATSGYFTAWSLSGMEVALFALLIVTSLYTFSVAATNPNPRRLLMLTGIILALATMTRPEGILVLGILLAAALGRSMKKRDASLVLWLFAGFGILYVPYYVWRFSYYGYPLPNTFYAKVGASSAQVRRGLGYLWDFVSAYFPLLSAALLGTVLAWRQAIVRWALAICLAFLVYSVLVGGDCMPAFRFIAPVAPLIALLAGTGLSQVFARFKTRATSLFATLLATGLLAGLNLYGSFRHPAGYYSIGLDKVAHYGRLAGQRLRQFARPDAVIATNTAGTVPYYSGLRTIDMLGMNDRHIAHLSQPLGQGRAGHEKADGDYVLSRRPDYIQFGTSWGSDRPHFRGDSQIAQSPLFREGYVLRTYPLADNLLLALFVRRDTFE